MDDNGMNELSPREQDALRSLSGSGAYSRSLENRIAKTLKSEGLITPSASIWGRAAKVGGMVAALIAAFVLGTQYGNRGTEMGDQPMPVASPGPDVPEYESSRTGEFEYTAYHMDMDDLLESDARPDRNATACM